jgi:HAMP domain-containing protein
MFGWGHTKKASPREAQIAQFKKAYPSANETAREEDNVFDIHSRTNGGANFTIRIFLSNSFPSHKPAIMIYMAPGFQYSHPAINDRTHEISGLDKLNRWHSECSLVEVVNDCLTLGSRLDSFRVTPGQQPPPPTYAQLGQQGQGQQQQQSSQSSSYAGAYLSTSQRQLQHQPASQQEVTPPPPVKAERKQSDEFHSVVLDVPTSFPELQKLSESQLERLLSDDVALKSHMGTIGAVSSLRELRESVRASNLEHALEAMQMEADISRLAEECTELQQSLRRQVTEFLSVRDNINNLYGLKAADVKIKLEAKITENDNKSEELGDQFVSGAVDLQTFLATFRTLRMDYHSLQIKANCI